MMLLALSGCVFLAMAFAIMGLVMEAQSKRMSDRFTSVASSVLEDDLPQDLQGSIRERLLDPMLARLSDFASVLTPKASAKAVVTQLERAGRPWGLTPAMWVLARIVCALGGAVAGLILARHLPIAPPLRMCAMMVIAAVGMMGPGFMLDAAIKRRQATIRVELPDIIDLLVVSVEAGLGLDAAVLEVVERRKGPLLDELARVLGEVQVGKTRRAAWQDMAGRVDLPELKGFVAALMQGEELGASVSGVLRSQSDAVRMRRSLHVREVAAVLPVKMLFPLVFFIFPGMFVVILGPGMLSMMSAFESIGF